MALVKGKTGILGFDISKHQGLNGTGVLEGLRKEPDAKFIIIKATEGKNYTDPAFMANFDAAVKAGLLIGIYHYARPDLGNSPELEAEEFVRLGVRKINPEGVVFILDYEGSALNSKYGDWALRWCRRVEELTEKKPLVYTNKAGLNYVKECAENDNGLWLAYWDSEFPKNTGAWNLTAMWQYEVRANLDRDIFFGTKEQFLKYAQIHPSDMGECHCGCRYCCGGEE